MWNKRLVFSVAPLLIAGLLVRADDDATGVKVKAKPQATILVEPMAKELSLAKAGEFLDGASLKWTREKNCGSCHTNYPYLMARPLLRHSRLAAHDEVRKFFETRAEKWESGNAKDKPRWDTEVVATAVALAINDAQTTNKLHPMTHKALDKMWTLQKPNGAWNWLKCNWPPMEHDDYFGAAFVAVGVGLAPGDYAKTPAAKEGIAKLQKYLQSHPSPSLHHQTWLLWASAQMNGFMAKEDQSATAKRLRALQREDGGWSLPSLGDWKGNDGRANDVKAPSDGYATGLVVYVLRQAGVPADDAQIAKGVSWLKTNQRETGRWFTRSLNNDKHHYISHAGTAFAVMALAACEPSLVQR